MNTFKKLVVISSLALCSTTLLADTLRGKIFEDSSKNTVFRSFENTTPVDRKIILDEKFKFAMDKVILNSPNYVFEIEGDISNDSIVTGKVPRVVGDITKLEGSLSVTEAGEYFIDNQKIKFGRTKPIYDFNFDKKSQNHYVGKSVLTDGHFEKDQSGESIFVINAILEKDLITASSNNIYSASKDFEKDPVDFILNEMPKNENSQSLTPFRSTIIGKGHNAKPGDSVLIITLSGRQGEIAGATGGHYAIGMGEVQDDMRIKGETFNFYFKGEKEVLAGNTGLVSYFGHLIQGQQNYRPTYTLYVYGVDKKKLRFLRDEFEKETNRVRTEPGLGITAAYNCTTTSNDTLEKIGIYGNHKNFFAKTFDPQNLWILNPLGWWSRNAKGDGTISSLRQLSYVMKKDRQYYMPRNALESFIINFDYKLKRKKMGIKRVDYVFIPQTPSARQIGGMSYNQIGEANKTIKFQKAQELRTEKAKAARAVLASSEATAEQIEMAQEVLRNTPTKEQELAATKELLDTID